MTRSISIRVVLIIVLFFLLTLRIYAQGILDKKIVLSEQELSIHTILSEIRKQVDVDFSYGSAFPLTLKITFSQHEIAVSEILKRIKAETGFSYKVSGKKIMLVPPPKKHTISGYLRDAASGENLIGANVYTVPMISGTFTNTYGHYGLTLPSDSVTLICSYIGYESRKIKFFLDKDTILNVTLSSQTLQEVVITDEDRIQDITRMSTIEIPVAHIEALPAMAGEIDPLKTLQLLPGVQSGTEASSGLYVRGGSPDQNLILLDGVPVYNASHLFGFFSVFNSDAINHIELIKGGFPARYGGRLSSVVNISMKEGDQQKFKGQGSIGLIASRLTLEGQLKRNKSSFLISARRTLTDIFARPFIEEATDGDHDNGYHFYDLNAKVNYHINDHNRLYLSVYTGNDKIATSYKRTLNADTTRLSNASKYRLAWGNVTAALRLNSVITPKVFSNLTATYSQYRMNTLNQVEEDVKTTVTHTNTFFRSYYISGIRDIAVREDFDITPNINHSIKTGAYGIYHSFSPGALTYNVISKDTVVGSYDINALEYGAYAEDDINLSRRLKLNLGLHYAAFLVEDKNYSSIQPRLALRYLLTDKIALKASYVQMKQFIHLLTNVGIGLPTDLWLPATPLAKPEDSWQAAGGITYSPGNAYEFILEGYYKQMTGLIEYKNGASFLQSEKDWQSKIETGNGESYGTEIFVRKKSGAFTGWMGYTLAWAFRQFENIDAGQRFPFKYDRRHDLEVAAMYAWNEKIDLSLTWVYGSGYPVTLATASYNPHSMGIPGNTGGAVSSYVEYIPGRNNFRMQDYHRLDASISFSKKKKWGERRWVFGLYNAYNRKNPFYLSVEGSIGFESKRKVVQHSLFPIIPSVSYNFKF